MLIKRFRHKKPLKQLQAQNVAGHFLATNTLKWLKKTTKQKTKPEN